MSATQLKTVVSVSQTRKVNLGNFESADIQISIQLESLDNDEDFLFAKAADFVEEKLAKEVLALQKKSVNPLTQKQAVENDNKPSVAKADAKVPEPKPAKETKPVKPSEDEEPAAKPAKVAKPAKEEPAADEEETTDEKPTLAIIKEALKLFAQKTSKQDAVKLMQKVAKVDKSDDVPEKLYTKLLLELKEKTANLDQEDL